MPIREMPQSNKQHAVPQNIMDVEFKLIGDLTMRQFTYLAVFFGGAYVIYTLNLPPFFKWPIIILIVLAGAAFAFVPFEERGLDEWIVNFFRAVYAEQQYIWRKNPLPPSAFLYQSLSIVRQELITLAPTASRRKLENYLEYQYEKQEVLDPYEKLEASYIQKVKDAFGDYSNTPTTAVALEEEFLGSELPNIGQPTQQVTYEEETLPVGNIGDAQQESSINAQAETQTQRQVQDTGYEDSAKQQQNNQPKMPGEVQVKTSPVVQPVQQSTPILKSTLVQRAHSTLKSAIKPVARRITRPRPMTLPGESNEIVLRPVTPDMHAGRKITNLASFQGNIVLPIRGERMIKTTEEIESANDVVKKAEQLKSYIQQLKQAEKTAPIPREKTINTEVSEADLQVSNEAEDLISKFQKEKEDLLDKIEALKSKIRELSPDSDATTKQQTVNELKDLEEKESETEDTITKLREQVSSLNIKSSRREDEEPEVQSTKLGVIPDNLQPQTPNTVAGIVRNIRGRGLPNVLLVIKNSKNEPVRAVKTNALGEFTISNPLPSGSYKVEVDVNNSTGFTFDIINFDAKGAIIPAIEFVGK